MWLAFRIPNGMVAIVKATAEMEDDRRFSGIGDASPENVGRNIAPAPPSAGGDIDCDQVDGPIPTPPGDPDNLDGDNDGLACE